MGGIQPVFRAVAISCILLSVTMLVATPPASAEPVENSESVLDGRIIGVLTAPDQTYERTWAIRQGEWTSLMIDCDQCTVTLDIDGETTTVTSVLNVQAASDGAVRLSITSPIQEFVAYSLIEKIDEQNPTVRPSPEENMAFESPWVCQASPSCVDLNKGLHAIAATEFTPEQHITGILEQNVPEYVSIPAQGGESLELQLAHATSGIDVKVFYQTETESLFDKSLTQATQLPANTETEAMYWHAENDGRFMLKISSETPETAFAIKRVLYSNEHGSELVNISTTPIVEGHHSKTIVVDTTETQAVVVQAFHANITAELEQLVSGTWLTPQEVTFAHVHATYLYPYPNASAFRVTATAERFAFELTHFEFDDLDSQMEAPSLRPSSSTVANTSWPILQAPNGALEAELTLSIHDTADVFKIEISGYEESIHLVQVKVMSDQLDNLKLEMWDIDQTNWEIVDERTVTQVNGKIQTALELAPGTHFVRISHIDEANVTDHSWGSHVPSLFYLISTGYTVIDEGEEPYFPPDESTVMWGEVARWVMGLLFLAPCAYFGLIFASNRKTARELSLKTKQLAWFKSQMDAGEKAPSALRKSLDKSLQAIAQLDWATACNTWGPTDSEHRTEGLAMAIWRLDPRLAKQASPHPLMVGIHVLDGQWELAALRFDAPEGEPWKVVNVEPKFLHRGEEIFVDTMREGNLTFLTLELEGTAETVDVELNGRWNGEAMAARVPQTVRIHTSEEE